MRPIVLAAALALPAVAETLVPARPGVILYREGQVLLDGTAVKISPAHWLEMHPDAVLATGDGRAEVLVNPCTLLHLGEHGRLRMVRNSLTGARLELLTGSVAIEADVEAASAAWNWRFNTALCAWHNPAYTASIAHHPDFAFITAGQK